MKLGLIISSLFYFMTLMLIQNEGCNGCVENERMGLLEIKKYIVSQVEYYNKELSSWVDDRDHSNCCSWKRVKCSNFSSGHITKLSIQGLLFATPHPNMLNISLFRPFEELRLLDLSLNGFRGWIGNKGFPRLKKLETLDLTNNNLKGSILSSLNGLTALKTLKLSYNSIYNNYPTQGTLSFCNLFRLNCTFPPYLLLIWRFCTPSFANFILFKIIIKREENGLKIGCKIAQKKRGSAKSHN
ncbi:putative non-specific serine/threonine protein kinase [Medicago truncatula]|uniref:Putative non-specific serine/threonine protein kinase n=1 Tax=Medicago truncatula TaxID=3880 RepID=A0A396HZW0_MEDTR|nr:putative non-specific serine/threonine protein kinase [Medicago truncatula]